MRELSARVTSKGQVTIPVEVRRRLGIETPDNVTFIIDDDEVRLSRRRSVVLETAGAVHYDGPPLSAQEMREAAETAIAEDVIERMSR